MRATILLLCLILSITSCNNSEKNNDPDADPNQNVNQNIDQNSKQNTISDSEDIATDSNEKERDAESEKKDKIKSEPIAGSYINTEHAEDNNCKCYCLEVATGGSSQLCLKENEMYIDARFQQDGDNINIFYNGKSEKTTAEKIPWDKFETGTPIAVLSPGPNGDLKLDWKGFRIDGEIAIDYALLGKKTLEGTYKKK